MLPLLLMLAGPRPCPGLPLKRGTSWTYRARVAWDAGGGREGRQTVRWTTTVVRVLSSDSAVAATVRGWPDDLAWWEPQKSATISVIYCTRGRIYLLHPQPDSAQALAASLLSGARHPGEDDVLLELPLRTGHLYGRDAAERNDTFYAWFVESAESIPPAVRRMRPDLGDSLYTVVYRTNPDHTILGVVPGLGIAHYVYVHHGTVAEADAWLVGYEEGP